MLVGFSASSVRPLSLSFSFGCVFCELCCGLSERFAFIAVIINAFLTCPSSACQRPTAVVFRLPQFVGFRHKLILESDFASVNCSFRCAATKRCSNCHLPVLIDMYVQFGCVFVCVLRCVAVTADDAVTRWLCNYSMEIWRGNDEMRSETNQSKWFPFGQMWLHLLMTFPTCQFHMSARANTLMYLLATLMFTYICTYLYVHAREMQRQFHTISTLLQALFK